MKFSNNYFCQNFAECLLNFDQKNSGFFQNAATFRSFHGAFTELSRSLRGAFTPHCGPFRTGTSSAGVCIWPVGPLLAHAAPLGLPAALRDFHAATVGASVESP